MPYIVSQRQNEADDCGCENAHASAFAIASVASLPDPCRSLFPSIEEFYREGSETVDRCLEQGTPCCVAIVDIDRLQRVADLHGPSCAAGILAAFAEKLLDIASGQRMAVAYLGSDKFGLLWDGGAGPEAAETFDRLKLDLTARPLIWEGETIPLTVSIGVADIHGRETFDNYLNAAEQFLFMAKMSGRNQVVCDYTFLVVRH